MTTTVPPPAPAHAETDRPDPPPTGPGARRRGEHRAGGSSLLVAEVSATLMTAAAIVGFGRIFESWEFLAPMLVVAAASHGVAAVARRRGLGLPTAALLSAITWVLVVTWLFFVETTTALLPTADTWAAVRAELDRSWETFHDVVAPAPVQAGFLVATAAAVGFAAFLVDWAAFRMWSAREALVAPLTLFVFATILADDRGRIASAAAMTAAVVLFLLTHRVARLERSAAWVGAGARSAGRRMLAAGAVVGAAAVAVGAVAAPLLPGVDDDAIVDLRGDGAGDNSRLLDSPLVSIRSRLVDTSDTPLFSVRSDARSYWRITALDRFDGTQWRFSASTDQDADGRLGLAGGLAAGSSAPIRQQVTIDELRTEWLPAAYRPVEVRPLDAPRIRYDAETDTLIADDPTAAGTSYEVVSISSSLTPEMLRTADREVPRWVQPSLELPDDFSELATATARDVTAGLEAPYDQAMALQEFFRVGGGFTYSTEVDIGQGTDAIEEFLQIRQGYCEQFAASFAAMARSLGLPARVAVGYTWGEQDPADPDLWQVLGRNAHAWPEVHLGRFGWVAFEPTPGRGNPAAEAYTGVPADQTDDPVEQATTTTEPGAPPEPTTTLPPAPLPEAAAPTSGTSAVTDDPIRTAALGLAVVAAVVGAYLLAVPGSLALRRRRRRARAGAGSAARASLAWAETTEVLAGGGVRARPDETHAELARRAGSTWPDAAPPLDRLAGAADAAAFGDPDGAGADGAPAPSGPAPAGGRPRPAADPGPDPQDDADAVRRAVDAGLGTRGRLLRLLDPRPLWAHRRRRHRIG